MIREVILNEKRITFVGTAHISKENALQVKEIIETKKPDVVCIELDKQRLYSLLNKDKIKKPKITAVFRSKKPSVFLLSYVLSGIQGKLAKKYNVNAGDEMLSAIESAKKVNSKIALIDRDINITLLKLIKNLTFKEKFKVLFSGFYVPKKDLRNINIDRLLKDVEEGKENSDMIEYILQIFTKQHKKLKEILIDQRDQFMAYQLQNIPGEEIVVVVGAGHVNGIIANLNNNNIDLKKILTVT